MKKTAIILSIGALVAGVLPVAAQEHNPEGGSVAVEHAQLGLFEAVGAPNNRVIIALPNGNAGTDRQFESFATNEQTLVEGAGGVMDVTNALDPFAGNVVVVTYVDQDQHLIAKKLAFAEDRIIHGTRGAIRSIDAKTHSIVVRNADGRDETMLLDVGSGAAIDSDAGLRSFADLRVGQQVTVYFSKPGSAELVRIA